MQTKLRMNESVAPKPPAGAAIFLGIALISLIVLIVYQLKARTAATTPVAPTYADAMAKITTDADALRRKLNGKDSQNIEKALSERLALKKELAREPAPAAAVAPSAQPHAESPLTPDEGALNGGEPDEPSSALPPLKGIMWTEKNPLAIVNGALVGANDSVGEFTVTAIEEDCVILQGATGERHVLRLHPSQEANRKAEP